MTQAGPTALPTVRQLEGVVALAKYLNFRQAAQALFITQPALSAQIQQVETALGVRLFERDRSHVLPTRAGKEVVARASTLLVDLRDLAVAAQRFDRPLTGTLRLGVIPTVAPYLLPSTLGSVHHRYPELRLLLREDHTARLLQRLHAGELDVLLLALEADLGDACTLPILRDPFVLVVPVTHRLATRKRAREQDLTHETVLLLEDGHCLRDQALSLCKSHGADETDDFRASSLSTLVQMVAGGAGVTLLPEIALEVECSRDPRLVPISFRAKGPARTLGLAWRPSCARAPEFGLLARALREAAQSSGVDGP